MLKDKWAAEADEVESRMPLPSTFPLCTSQTGIVTVTKDPDTDESTTEQRHSDLMTYSLSLLISALT